MEEPSQFSVGQAAQSLICSIMEKPQSGLDDCLRVLQACFRKRMSDQEPVRLRRVRLRGGGQVGQHAAEATREAVPPHVQEHVAEVDQG